MKVYQIMYDSIIITIIAEDMKDVYQLLIEDDANYYREGNKVKYKWNEQYSDEVLIREIPLKRGIIHSESH